MAHAARTAFFAGTVGEMYFQEGIVSGSKHKNIIVTAGLHDNARENDGVDIWDEKSGQVCVNILKDSLNVEEKEAALFGRSIAMKDDKNPSSLDEKLIHDADCIEIIRP